MKIIYASVNIDHHMIPFAKAITEIVGENNFRYAVLAPIDQDRIKLGFDSNCENNPWVIRAYSNKKSYREFEKWFNDADVALFSYRSLFNMAHKRVKNEKLTYYFSERWFKPPFGKFRLLNPRLWKFSYKLRILSKNNFFHYLAQGAYAEQDIRLIGSFENRIWNCGYFPDVSENESIVPNHSNIQILWCGRMLKWKKVDSLIKAFSIIIQKYPNCHLTIVGDGTEKKKLMKLAYELLPYWSYDFKVSHPFKDVRAIMKSSDIYVLPSNAYEGWGAVLNESMAEGCAVIASIETGGGKSIIQDMENGLLFNSGSYMQLSEKLKLLLDDRILLNKLKINGQKTMNEIWSPYNAAFRFIEVSKALLGKRKVPIYDNGPMKCLNTNHEYN